MSNLTPEEAAYYLKTLHGTTVPYEQMKEYIDIVTADLAELRGTVERLAHITASMSAWLTDEDYDHSHGNPNVSMNEPCDACIVDDMVKEADAALALLAPDAPPPGAGVEDQGKGINVTLRYRGRLEPNVLYDPEID